MCLIIFIVLKPVNNVHGQHNIVQSCYTVGSEFLALYVIPLYVL